MKFLHSLSNCRATAMLLDNFCVTTSCRKPPWSGFANRSVNKHIAGNDFAAKLHAMLALAQLWLCTDRRLTHVILLVNFDVSAVLCWAACADYGSAGSNTVCLLLNRLSLSALAVTCCNISIAGHGCNSCHSSLGVLMGG